MKTALFNPQNYTWIIYDENKDVVEKLKNYEVTKIIEQWYNNNENFIERDKYEKNKNTEI